MFNFKNTRLAFDLVTISHTVFVLPLIFSGYLFTSKEFIFIDLLLITIASFGARNIAFIFNRYTDREIDKKNPRTLLRPIPSGKTSNKFLISFLILSFLIFIIPSLILCISTIYLIPIPIILFYIYPFLKRFTYLCHYFLGLVLSLSPLAGFYVYDCSTLNILDMLPLSIFTFFWISGFDILYALQDYESDVKNKIFSIPSYFGKKRAILISFISFILAIFILSHYQTIIFDRTIFGKSIILLILINFISQIYFSNKGNFDFFRYNSYIGFLILLLTISDIFNI
tara:strand:- start:47001 stop:47852 length:852 start_codon:yes stop_codon:yes gene_type:complete